MSRRREFMMDALFISFSGFFVLLENQKVSEKVSKRYRIESKYEWKFSSFAYSSEKIVM